MSASYRRRWVIAVVSCSLFLALAGTGTATAQVKVDYQKAEVKTRRFDPENPPADMPELKAGEAAVCESKFACEVVVEVEITEPAGGKPTALVAGVNATLRLNVVIWLPIDTTPKIRIHEDGHRQISELFYARGEKTANELREGTSAVQSRSAPVAARGRCPMPHPRSRGWRTSSARNTSARSRCRRRSRRRSTTASPTTAATTCRRSRRSTAR